MRGTQEVRFPGVSGVTAIGELAVLFRKKAEKPPSLLRVGVASEALPLTWAGM